jgi:hypothetical protein
MKDKQEPIQALESTRSKEALLLMQQLMGGKQQLDREIDHLSKKNSTLDTRKRSLKERVTNLEVKGCEATLLLAQLDKYRKEISTL